MAVFRYSLFLILILLPSLEARVLDRSIEGKVAGKPVTGGAARVEVGDASNGSEETKQNLYESMRQSPGGPDPKHHS